MFRHALLVSAFCLVGLPVAAAELPAPLPDVPDPPTEYPAGELGRMVKLGEEIIMTTNTHPLTKDLVGNDLQCKSCHLDGGKTKSLGTFIGTATAFPAFSVREKTVQTLQNRINNCFMRSMNGKRPIIDTEASVAMAAYVTWLSTGLPIKMNEGKPVNPYFTDVWWGKNWVMPLVQAATHETYVAGEALYVEKCAACHQEDGKGLVDGGEQVYPPLWGDRSYNSGAGLGKPERLPVWLLYNMPLGDPHLTRQEAVALSIYINAQPRPSFDLKDGLFPPDQMGHYNSLVLEETHTVRSVFKRLGLDVDVIRGDTAIATN